MCVRPKQQHPESIIFNEIFLIDYLHKDDETIASHGSISMKMAMLRDTEPTCFEIQSIPSRPDDSGIKWVIKANNPADAHRWTRAIAESIEWYKMCEGTDSDACLHRHPTFDLSHPLAMPPFIFTGGEELDSWINELNDYFSRNNFQEAEKLPTAMEFLSADVRSVIDRVQGLLQQVIAQQRPTGDDDTNLKAFKLEGGPEWSWSYSRLEGALRRMQSEESSIIHHTRGTRYLTETSSVQIEEYRKKAEKARTNTLLKGGAIVGGGIATAVGLPVAVPAALGLVGFSAGGIVAGE